MRYLKNRKLCPLFCIIILAIFCLFVIKSINYGFAPHGDSRAILENSINSIIAGKYVRSRSFGFPLYEIPIAWVYKFGGIAISNLYSLVLTLVYGVIAYFLLFPIKSIRDVLIYTALIFNPLVLVNSTILMETSQTLALFTLSIILVNFFLSQGKLFYLGYVSLVSFAIVATRLDSVLFVISLFLVLTINTDREKRVYCISYLCLTLIASALLYASLNNGFEFLVTTDVLLKDNLQRRIVRAILGIVNIYGIFSILIIAVILFFNRNRLLQLLGFKFFTSRPTVVQLFLISLIFYLPRFIALPNKMEFIVIPYILSILCLKYVNRNSVSNLLVCGLCTTIILNSFLHISLFHRQLDGSDRYQVQIKFNKGSIFQDWDYRQYQKLLASLEFKDFISKSVYGVEESHKVKLVHPNFLPGFISNNGDLITDRFNLYRFDNPRIPDESLKFENYNKIFVCDSNIFLDSQAWRVFRTAPNTEIVDKFNKQENIKCNLMEP